LVTDIAVASQSLYILFFHDYRYWLAKYPLGQSAAEFCQRIGGDVATKLMDNFKARVWVLGPDDFLVCYGDKVVQVSSGSTAIILTDEVLREGLKAFDRMSSTLYILPWEDVAVPEILGMELKLNANPQKDNVDRMLVPQPETGEPGRRPAGR
jgi:hypothetical protein